MVMTVTTIKKGTDPEKDLHKDFGVYVISTKGLHDDPTKKKAFTESFADKNGQKVYEPVTPVYAPDTGIEIEFASLGSTSDVISKYKSFVYYLKKVIPYKEDLAFGSSSFEYWNDSTGAEHKRTLRYTEPSGNGKMTYGTVTDYSNPGSLVSAWTFKLKFTVDAP